MVESELWVTMHKQPLLSKVFVPDMASDELIPFGLEHIQNLCRYLAWDAPIFVEMYRGPVRATTKKTREPLLREILRES